MVIKLTPLLPALLSLAAAAASAQPLDLATAMARARTEGREVIAADARRVAADARADEARGHRLPRVRISEQWLRTDSPADVFGLLLNQQRFSFDDFVLGDPNDPDPLETAITRLEVEVPIYTGGEISTRVEQARLVAAAAGADAGRTGDRAAVEAAEAWIRLAQAREAADLLSASRETVAAHVELARAYSDQGMVVRSELLRAQVELARVDDLLLEARGNARVAEANLAYRLRDSLTATYVLATLATPPAIADDAAHRGSRPRRIALISRAPKSASPPASSRPRRCAPACCHALASSPATISSTTRSSAAMAIRP